MMSLLLLVVFYFNVNLIQSQSYIGYCYRFQGTLRNVFRVDVPVSKDFAPRHMAMTVTIFRTRVSSSNIVTEKTLYIVRTKIPCIDKPLKVPNYFKERGKVYILVVRFTWGVSNTLIDRIQIRVKSGFMSDYLLVNGLYGFLKIPVDFKPTHKELISMSSEMSPWSTPLRSLTIGESYCVRSLTKNHGINARINFADLLYPVSEHYVLEMAIYSDIMTSHLIDKIKYVVNIYICQESQPLPPNKFLIQSSTKVFVFRLIGVDGSYAFLNEYTKSPSGFVFIPRIQNIRLRDVEIHPNSLSSSLAGAEARIVLSPKTHSSPRCKTRDSVSYLEVEKDQEGNMLADSYFLRDPSGRSRISEFVSGSAIEVTECLKDI